MLRKKGRATGEVLNLAARFVFIAILHTERRISKGAEVSFRPELKPEVPVALS